MPIFINDKLKIIQKGTLSLSDFNFSTTAGANKAFLVGTINDRVTQIYFEALFTSYTGGGPVGLDIYDQSKSGEYTFKMGGAISPAPSTFPSKQKWYYSFGDFPSQQALGNEIPSPATNQLLVGTQQTLTFGTNLASAATTLTNRIPPIQGTALVFAVFTGATPTAMTGNWTFEAFN